MKSKKQIILELADRITGVEKFNTNNKHGYGGAKGVVYALTTGENLTVRTACFRTMRNIGSIFLSNYEAYEQIPLDKIPDAKNVIAWGAREVAEHLGLEDAL